MPWTKDDVSRFKSGLTESQKEQWVEVANSALQSCLNDGGSQENCEASAIRQANGVVGNSSVINHTIRIDNNVNYRYASFHNRRHIVAPVVLMTEGVHHGSAGRILYTRDQLQRMPLTWNGRPVPVLHPMDNNGSPVTCNDPRILEEQNVGQVFNVEWEEETGRLKGEVWIDLERAKEVCQRRNLPDVINMIQRNEPVEVSTGLHPEESVSGGVWNGQEYDAQALGIHADHLALLPGGKGACSWEDGCGIRNQQGGKNGMKRTKESNANSTVNSQNSQPKEHPLQANQVGEGYSELLGKVQQKLDSMDDDYRIHFLEELYEDQVVYRIRNTESDEQKYYMRGYTVNDDGTVEFQDEPEQVKKQVSYEPINQENKKEEGNMTKNNDQKQNQTGNGCCPEKIEAVINSQSNGFTEQDREFLVNQNEEFIDKLPVDNQDSTDQTQNQNQAQNQEKNDANQTSEQKVDFNTLLQNADAETRQSIERGKQLFLQERNSMIQKIMNADGNQFTQDELKSMDHNMLLKIANSISGSAVDYSLNGGSSPNVQSRRESEYEEGLSMPWIQEDESQKQETQNQ